MIEELEPYLVKFDKTCQIIPKIYLLNYEIEEDKWKPVIVITHDKCIFLSNDNSCFG